MLFWLQIFASEINGPHSLKNIMIYLTCPLSHSRGSWEILGLLHRLGNLCLTHEAGTHEENEHCMGWAAWGERDRAKVQVMYRQRPLTHWPHRKALSTVWGEVRGESYMIPQGCFLSWSGVEVLYSIKHAFHNSPDHCSLVSLSNRYLFLFFIPISDTQPRSCLPEPNFIRLLPQ